jgi:methyl-accepting chemotaxis protein
MSKNPWWKSMGLPRRRLGRLGRALLWRFTLFALLSLVIISFMGFYGAWRDVQDAILAQQETARWLAGLVEEWLEQIQNSLTFAAQYPGLMTLAPDGQAYYLRQVMDRNPSVSRVFLIEVDLNGQGVETLQVSDGMTYPGTDVSDQDWFQDALTRGVHVAPVRYGETGMPQVRLVAVVKERGRVTGLVVAEAQLTWAYKMLHLPHSGERGGYVYVVDEQGRPLLHEKTPFILAARPRTDIEGILAAIGQRPMPSIYLGLNQEEESVIGAYHPLERAPWFVIAEQPTRRIVRGLLPVAYTAFGVLAVSIVAAVAVGLYISRRLVGPVMRLREGARRISAGELEHRIHLRGKGELADLAEEFNRMTGQLQELIRDLEQRNSELQASVQECVNHLLDVSQGDLSKRLSLDEMARAEGPLLVLRHNINETTASLQQMVVEIRDASNSLSTASAEILAATTQQASGMGEQSAAVAEVSTTIDEISNIAEQTTHQAQGVAGMAHRTAEISQSGQQAVADTIQGMVSVKKKVESIADEIMALSKQAQTIEQIILTVSEIAAQSNLLALNAAVEAARAGEAGRGFTIVAQEIHSLAEQSQAATTQVKGILGEIQRGVSDAVRVTDEGLVEVDEGMVLAEETSKAIQELAESVNASVGAATQIVAEASQQQAGVEQVAQGIKNIHTVSTQSVLGAHQVEQAAEQLNALARELQQLVARYQL